MLRNGNGDQETEQGRPLVALTHILRENAAEVPQFVSPSRRETLAILDCPLKTTTVRAQGKIQRTLDQAGVGPQRLCRGPLNLGVLPRHLSDSTVDLSK